MTDRKAVWLPTTFSARSDSMESYVYKIVQLQPCRKWDSGEQCLLSSLVAWWRRWSAQGKQVRAGIELGTGTEPTLLGGARGQEAAPHPSGGWLVHSTGFSGAAFVRWYQTVP